MTENLIFSRVKEFSIELLKELAIWIGTCSTIQQTVINFFYDGISKFTTSIKKEEITYFMYIIFVIGIIVIIIKNIYDILKKEFIITVKNDKEHKIIIKIGNYEDNMKEVIKKVKSRNDDAIFVIGVNDDISMDMAERRGVHKSVMDKFYNDEERLKALQEKTNIAFNKEDGVKCEFGDIGIVEHNQNAKILFVVNSKHEEGQSTSIAGPQPGNIIRDVFKALEKQSAEIVQLPILSSRNVRCIENNKIRFSVTIAEIIEQYFQELLNNSNIDYDLVLSIRKEDLKENSITIKNIVKFIKDLKPMYHIK